MTPADLIAIARSDYLDDEPDMVAPAEVDYRFKTAFLLRETVNAQKEACFRQDLRHLYDATTPAICTIPLVYGTRSYALDARILRIADARMTGDSPLTHVSQSWLDTYCPTWRSQSGSPRFFCVMGRTLVLDRAPDAADTLSLAVWRAPLSDPGLTTALEWTSEPEKLAHWLAHRAYLRPNEDTRNVELAQYHRTAFDAAFGRENSAQARNELLTQPDAVFFPSTANTRTCYTDCNDWGA